MSADGLNGQTEYLFEERRIEGTVTSYQSRRIVGNGPCLKYLLSREIEKSSILAVLHQFLSVHIIPITCEHAFPRECPWLFSGNNQPISITKIVVGADIGSKHYLFKKG